MKKYSVCYCFEVKKIAKISRSLRSNGRCPRHMRGHFPCGLRAFGDASLPTRDAHVFLCASGNNGKAIRTGI
nr:MAG TPA: hypothetical protein [Herelleviridae sp.]